MIISNYSYDLLKKIERFLTATVDSLLPSSPPTATTTTHRDNSNLNRRQIQNPSFVPTSTTNNTGIFYPTPDTLTEETDVWSATSLIDYNELLKQTEEQIQKYQIIPDSDEIASTITRSDTSQCTQTIQQYFQSLESSLSNKPQQEYDESYNYFVSELNSIAIPIFDKIEQHIFQLNSSIPCWKSLLLQYMFLCHVKKCNHSSISAISHHQHHHQQSDQYAINNDNVTIKIQGKDLKLIQEFIHAGEPKNGNYSNALNIYNTIVQSNPKASSGVSSNNIFHRLAIAVALEFDQPVHIFDNKLSFIDPVQRYKHYEEAFCNGELDQYFPTLSTWELRMVVNNDAHDDEIQWCRRMLRNYRPDHILLGHDRNSYQWKYCKIVKTDVRYKVPEWKQYPKTYKQLLSGGGKCGPRAWFGRFVCKSFGIPTWGVRQPGHAAMSHWIPPFSNDGSNSSSVDWVICLGGPNWTKSHWDGKKGIHFHWEAQARRVSPHLFDDLMIWLRCFECFARKTGNDSNKENFWQLLQLLKMWQIVFMKDGYRDCKNKSVDDTFVVTSAQRIKEAHVNDKGILIQSNGDMTFPASSNCNPKIPRNDFIVTKSFHKDGGFQVHLRGNAFLKYHIDVPKSSNGPINFAKYQLTITLVTVHNDTTPLSLRVASNTQDKIYEIIIPYTEGEWALTDPIEVELSEGARNLLHFFRHDDTALGITIKEFTLKRLD